MFFEWYWAYLFGFIIQVIGSTTITVFVHRTWCHRGLNSGPGVTNFSRFWLWIGGWYWPNLIQHFAATHRKHHRLSDTVDDPHSPYFYTFKELVLERVDGEGKPGRPYYMPQSEVNKWASDVPQFNDWMEDNVYRKYPGGGKYCFIAIYLILFGPIGFLLAGIPWMIFTRFSPRLHNWFSHKVGYRNQPHADGIDKSTNIVPVGILWGGEEFGANHHDDAQSPRFSNKWYEFDIGWLTVLVLAKLDLVEFIDGRQLKGKWYSCLFKKELDKAVKK